MTRLPRPDTLKAELARYRWLKEKLLEAHGDLDQETLADTLEGASTLIELLGAVVRSQIAEPDFTLSQRLGIAPLLIIDEEAIPDTYWAPQPARLKRADLRQALGDGKDIPGALLGNAQPTVSIRTR